MVSAQNKAGRAGNWIADGEKYAIIGLEVKLEDDLPLTQLTPNHWVMADPRFSIPEHWKGWLGMTGGTPLGFIAPTRKRRCR